METKGYYSLVQFLPDLSRLEAVNIGVVVYSPATQGVGFRLLRTHAKVKHFFGKQDWSFLDYCKEALEDRLTNESFTSREHLQEFIGKRANAIQMTALQSITVADVQQDAERLYTELVVQTFATRRKRVNREFSDKLLAAGVSGLLQKSVQVRTPYFEAPLRAAYAYQNGRYNLLTPIQFGSDMREIFSKVGEKAVEGEVLYSNPDPVHGDLCLNVVAQFAHDMNSKLRGLIEDVFREHKVKLYNFDNLGPLVSDIKKAAEDHALP